MNKPLIGSPVLETLGLHTRDILATAAKSRSGVFDVPENVDTVSYQNRVTRIYSGIFHSDPGTERAQEDTSDI